MATYSFESFFYNRSDLGPGPAISSVCLKVHTRKRYPGLNEQTFLTPECFSASEFDAQIKRLHAELEHIRKEVRKKYTNKTHDLG